ncbi:MAG: shikimate kinase AroK [Tahibacter sp.]
MNPSTNLFLIGPMGAGKTTIGRRIAEALHLPFHDLDHVIEDHSGASIPLIFDVEGECGFRKRERTTLAELAAMDGIVLATGGGAVLDPDNRDMLRRRGYVVYLETDVERQLARLSRDRKRPLLATPDRRERLEQLANMRNVLYCETADLRIRASSDQVPQVVAELLAELACHWQRPDATWAA